MIQREYAMSRFAIRRWLTCFLLSLSLVMPAASAMAQRNQPEPAAVGTTPSSGKGYTMAYLITIVLVAGGLAAVCRPSFRRTELRREMTE